MLRQRYKTDYVVCFYVICHLPERPEVALLSQRLVCPFPQMQPDLSVLVNLLDVILYELSGQVGMQHSRAPPWSLGPFSAYCRINSHALQFHS